MQCGPAGDDIPVKIDYVWAWSVRWFGWRRCLWLAVVLDFRYWQFGGVLFGLTVVWGRVWRATPIPSTRPGAPA